MKIKKIILLIVAVVLSSAVFSQEQTPENCPFGGIENCTGQCGLFTDANSDGICDNAILRTKTTEPKQDTKTEEKQVQKTQQEVVSSNTSNQNIGNNPETEITKIEQTEDTQTQTTIVADTEQIVEQTPKARKFPYHLWQVLIATLGLYIVSAILVKAKVVKKARHRKFWNFLLLITCLVSCLIGIYVVLAKMYSWSMDYMTLMQLHVDFGVSMTVIALIHILWHLNYWKNLFKSAGKKA